MMKENSLSKCEGQVKVFKFFNRRITMTSNIFKGAANYVGLALSYDQNMGRDSVIECVRQSSTVSAFTSFTNVVGEYSSPRNQVCH